MKHIELKKVLPIGFCVNESCCHLRVAELMQGFRLPVTCHDRTNQWPHVELIEEEEMLPFDDQF